MQRNDYDDKITVRLEIACGEYVRASLDHFDRLLIRDCEGSEKVSDHLLALETIVRRIEESAPPSTTAGTP